MDIEIFALCDAATVSGGKLNILGAFDSIYSAKTPIVHAQCAMAIRIRFPRIEEGKHRVKLSMVDADGRPVWPGLDGQMEVKLGAEDESAVTNFIVNVHQLKFENFGAYSIDLALDGRHEASLPLMVRKVQTSADEGTPDAAF